MDKRLMIACLMALAMMLLFAACEQPKAAAPKKTAPAEKPAAEQKTEAVKPVDVDALPEPEFTLTYCNLRITATRDELKSRQDNLADEQGDLKKLEAEPKSEDRDAAIASTKETIKSLTAEVSGLQRGLASIESKCKKPTASVCAEFTADADSELGDLKQEMLNEQKELEYIKDAKKLELQRRKLVLFEKRIAEWTGVVEELKAKCK